jgi:hypothetical protein
MKDADKHKAQVLWQNAKDSKLARREIARMTAKHKDAGKLATQQALDALPD